MSKVKSLRFLFRLMDLAPGRGRICRIPGLARDGASRLVFSHREFQENAWPKPWDQGRRQ